MVVYVVYIFKLLLIRICVRMKLCLEMVFVVMFIVMNDLVKVLLSRNEIVKSRIEYD